jgi:hypothetical protein
MNYLSDIPRVVGEFNADALNEKIDAIAAQHPDAAIFPVQALCSPDRGLMGVVNIRYKFLFRPGAFESATIDGQVAEVQRVKGSLIDIDQWHVDRLDHARLLTLPEILTTASRYPTKFLLGHIAIPTEYLGAYMRSDYNFWQSAAGKTAIHGAIANGDAAEHRFEPGEVVSVPPGTLHKRDIPYGATGFRFFMRKFPNQGLLHAGSKFGRLKVPLFT